MIEEETSFRVTSVLKGEAIFNSGEIGPCDRGVDQSLGEIEPSDRGCDQFQFNVTKDHVIVQESLG